MFGTSLPAQVASDPFTQPGAWLNLPSTAIMLAVIVVLVMGITQHEKRKAGGEMMNNNLDRKTGHPESRRALNRLLAITQYSLASYLVHAPSWTCRGEEPLLEAARRVAAGQQTEAVRVGRLLVRRHGYADLGRFPTRFTEYNDLAPDYLVQRLMEHQRRMIDEIGQCVEQLAGDPEAKRLAEEVLSGGKRHLSLLAGLPLPRSVQCDVGQTFEPDPQTA